MSGKPRRHKLLDAFSPDPSWVVQPLTDREQQLLAQAIIKGLIHRLWRKSSREAGAAIAAIEYASRLFPALRSQSGIQEAETMCAVMVGRLPEKNSRKLGNFLNHENPLMLFIESKQLHNALALQHGQAKREQWMRTLGLPKAFITEWSPENEAVLVESILAKRHGINRGKIHKLLAQGSRLIADSLKQQTESSL